MNNKKNKILNEKDLEEYQEDYRAKIDYENTLKETKKTHSIIYITIVSILLIYSIFVSRSSRQLDNFQWAILIVFVLLIFGTKKQLEQEKLENPPICTDCKKNMEPYEFRSKSKSLDINGIAYLCRDCKSKIIDTEPSHSG